MNRRNKGVRSDAPTYHTAYGVFTLVIVVVKSSNQHLQGSFGVNDRRRNSVDDRLKQWLKVPALVVRMIHRYAIASNGIEDRKIEVSVGRRQFQEKIMGQFEYLFDECIKMINVIVQKES